MIDSTSVQKNTPMMWAVHMAESVMKRPLPHAGKWAYEHGVVFKGFLDLWRVTGDSRYFNAVKDYIDSFVDSQGSIQNYHPADYNIDNINNGKLLFDLYRETGDERYRHAADSLRDQLRTHPRTSEGAFWHKLIYPYQIWLDGLYMGAPFYAQYIKEFGDEAEFDDVTRQFIICEKNTRDSRTGLFYHAYDEKREQFWCDPSTGLSQCFWGRAMGWYLMGLVDTLDFLTEAHRNRLRLLEILHELIEALAKVRDSVTGLWYQVLDCGDRNGNYLEASASCMITYAIAKAVRKGYLAAHWADVAEKAYQGIIDEFIIVTDQGLVNLNKNCQVAGLGGPARRDGTYAYYLSEPIVTNDYKGVGAFIQASIAMEQLR